MERTTAVSSSLRNQHDAPNDNDNYGRQVVDGDDHNHPNNRDILAEILNLSVSDISMSLEVAAAPQQEMDVMEELEEGSSPVIVVASSITNRKKQQQRGGEGREGSQQPRRRGAGRSKQQQQQPPQRRLKRRGGPPPTKKTPLVLQHLQQPKQQQQLQTTKKQSSNMNASRSSDDSSSGYHRHCSSTFLDDEKVTTKPLLVSRRAARGAGAGSGSSRPPPAAATAVAATASAVVTAALSKSSSWRTPKRMQQPKQQQQTIAATTTTTTSQQQQQRRPSILRIFSRRTPPPPPSTPPPSSSATAAEQLLPSSLAVEAQDARKCGSGCSSGSDNSCNEQKANHDNEKNKKNDALPPLPRQHRPQQQQQQHRRSLPSSLSVSSSCGDSSSVRVMPEFIELKTTDAPLYALRQQRSLISSTLSSSTTALSKRSHYLLTRSFLRRPQQEQQQHPTTSQVVQEQSSSSNNKDADDGNHRSNQQQRRASPNTVAEFHPFNDSSTHDSSHDDANDDANDDAKSNNKDDIQWQDTSLSNVDNEKHALQDTTTTSSSSTSTSFDYPTSIMMMLLESSDVYDSPVGVLRVDSFPFLGQATSGGAVSDVRRDYSQEECGGMSDSSRHCAMTLYGEEVLENVDDDEYDGSNKSLNSSSASSYAMNALPPGLFPTSTATTSTTRLPAIAGAATTTFATAATTPDGFPLLAATDSADTEITSNVTLGTSATSSSGSASLGVQNKRKKKKNRLFEDALTEKSKYASRKVRTSTLAASNPMELDYYYDDEDDYLQQHHYHHHFDQPSTMLLPSPHHNQHPQPQHPIKIYQLLGNVAERVSELSEDAGNLLGPMQACTSPKVGTDLIEFHDGNDNFYNNSNSNNIVVNSTAATPLFSCSSGCSPRLKQDANLASTTATTLSSSPSTLGSPPSPAAAGAGLGSILTPDSPYYNYRGRSSPNNTGSSTIHHPPYLRNPRNRVVTDTDEEGECPSTEVTLEATYLSKNTPQGGGVMALSEQCDKDNGDVVMKIAMLSHQDPSDAAVASLLRKRQIVSGAKRWSAASKQQHDVAASPPPPREQQRYQMQDEQPIEIQHDVTPKSLTMSSSTLTATRKGVSPSSSPTLRSSSRISKRSDFGQLPCQPVLSHSEGPHSMPPIYKSARSNRWLPHRPSSSAGWNLPPSPLRLSEDDHTIYNNNNNGGNPKQIENQHHHHNHDNHHHTPSSNIYSDDHRQWNNKTPVNLTVSTSNTSSSGKGTGISPVSVAGFPGAV